MTAPGWMPSAQLAATRLLMKMIFSKLRRQDECVLCHNWRGEPVNHAEHCGQSLREGWRVVRRTGPGVLDS